jgi:hypothetical protein
MMSGPCLVERLGSNVRRHSSGYETHYDKAVSQQLSQRFEPRSMSASAL